ncbi:unnamed protein product [Urochloa humidicola]
MAPRGRLLDLERHDVPFFYGAYHCSDDQASLSTHTLVFWPVFFLAAALLLHLAAPFQHATTVCAGFCVAYFFLFNRAVRPLSFAPSRPTAQCMTKKAGYKIEQNS